MKKDCSRKERKRRVSTLKLELRESHGRPNLGSVEPKEPEMNQLALQDPRDTRRHLRTVEHRVEAPNGGLIRSQNSVVDLSAQVLSPTPHCQLNSLKEQELSTCTLGSSPVREGSVETGVS